MPIRVVEGNPFAKKPEAKPSAGVRAVTGDPFKVDKRSGDKSVTRRIDAAVRGAADMLSFGFADEIAAAGDSLPALIPGGETYGEAYTRNVRQQRQIDAQDRRDVPVSRAAGQVAGFVGGLGAAAVTAPVRAAGASSYGANVLRGAAAGAGYGGLSAAGAAEGNVAQRIAPAAVGAGVGAAAGGAISAITPLAVRGFTGAYNALTGRPSSDVARAANVLQRRGYNPAQMQSAADDMAAVGVAPTGIDVVGERGRRLVRAVGVKTDTAGETLTANARARMADTKPAAMSATRGLSTDARTPTQFAEATRSARDAEAATRYGAFQNRPVQTQESLREMLRDAPGRSIIARARADAIENQDWPAQVELDKLLQVTDGPLPLVSAGTLDRLSIAARERGGSFASSGRNYRARGSLQRRDQIDAALDGIDDLKPARAAYRAKSQAIDVAEGDYLDPFTTDPGDYARWVRSLPPEARQANIVALRQDILDTLGGKKANSLGSLDQIESSPYFAQNLEAAVGPQAAKRYIANIGARLQQTRNASFVSPNDGSRTAVVDNDVGGLDRVVEGIKTAVDVKTGNVPSLLMRLKDAFERARISPADADALARVATDPAQLSDLLARMNRIRPGSGDEIGRIIAGVTNPAASRTAGEATQPRPSVEVFVEGRPDLGYGAAF